MKKIIIGIGILGLIISLGLAIGLEDSVSTKASVKVKALMSLTLENTPVNFPDMIPGDTENAKIGEGFPLVAKLGEETSIENVDINVKGGGDFESLNNSFPVSNMEFGIKKEGGMPDSSGVISYYRFEGNTEDETGNNPGVNHNAEYTDGRYGSCLEFKGRDDWVEIGDNGVNLDGMRELSISMWVKAEELSRYDTFIKKSNKHMRIYLPDEEGDFRFYLTNSEGRYRYLQTNSEPLDEEWKMITVTYDGNTGAGKMYVNEELLVEKDFKIKGDLEDNSDPLIIGERFYGKIDEARIWNRILSTEEVISLFSTNSVISGGNNTNSSVFIWEDYSTTDKQACGGLNSGENCNIFHRLTIPEGVSDGDYQVDILVSAEG
jgi:hypothetical protein